MDRMRRAAEAAAMNRDRAELIRALEKAVTTTMIGALAVFEEAFGSDERWADCRTEVLNLGNARRRALLAEIEQYDVVKRTWRR